MAECLQEDIDWMKLLEDDPYAGQHWCTSFKIEAKEVIRALVGLNKAEKIRNLLSKPIDFISPDELLDTFHHGISIESGQVIHFSTCRLPKGERAQIKTDSREDFLSWGKDIGDGGPVKYKKETPAQRLVARHRAVWRFCHAQEWGKYDPLFNNCEHFSRFCRVGKKGSRQVATKSLEALASLAENIPEPRIKVLACGIRKLAHWFGKPDYRPDSMLDHKTTLQKETIYGDPYENICKHTDR